MAKAYCIDYFTEKVSQLLIDLQERMICNIQYVPSLAPLVDTAQPTGKLVSKRLILGTSWRLSLHIAIK